MMPKLTHCDIGYAAKMIIDAHQDPSGEFKGFLIEGKLRSGKTAYAIKTMRDVFRALNPEMTMEEAYELALQHLHFELEPFLGLIKQRQKELQESLPKIDWTKRIPVLCLDDASIFAGTDLYFKDPRMYAAFSNTFTTIGSAVSGLLITTPSHEALAKPIREYYSYYVVEITKEDIWERLAKVKEWSKGYKTRTLKLKTIGEDLFSCHIPNVVYAKYLLPRLQKGEASVDEALAASKGKALAKDSKELAHVEPPG